MNNPRELVEERFLQLEAQVSYIRHNVDLLVSDLSNKLRLFKEDGGSNVEE